MEFKGSTGEWKLYINTYYPEILVKEENEVVNFSVFLNYRQKGVDGFRWNDNSLCDKSKYNALLISKAPEMLEMLKKAQLELRRIKTSMMVHPDCEEGSEFDDYTNSAQKTEDEIGKLIKDATEL